MKSLRLSSLAIALLSVFALCPVRAARAEFVGLERVASSINQPLFVTHAPQDRGRLFIVQKPGSIRILDLQTGALQATPFLNIPETDDAVEGGLLGLAFHPQFAANGKFYVYVTVDNGGIMVDGTPSPYSSQVREYTVSPDPNVSNLSYKTVWESVRPDAAHNAGWIGFSPVDNYLYVMSGDGGNYLDLGPGHTPLIGNAQDLTDNLLGKVLRLDVNGPDAYPSDPTKNYAIPSTNPFVGIEGDDEIWAYGLRNPYRASFDRVTGDLWIADVGQNAREEINFQPASSIGGENYGWRLREGSIQTDGGVGGERPANNVDPVYDYAHMTNGVQGPLDGPTTYGGYVYRGPDPELQGKFIFGDAGNGGSLGSRRLWMLDPADIPTDPSDPPLTITDLSSLLQPNIGVAQFPVSMGEDADGNLYITALHSHEVFRIKTNAFFPGDFTGDAVIDGLDLARWKAGFGAAAGATNGSGDADGDGDVDGGDFLAWQRHFGGGPFATTTISNVEVPEPSVAAILTALVASLTVRRRTP